MKLEEKLFKSFFYPFLIGVFLSTLVITIFLGLFTNDHLDKKTKNNIVNLETKYSKLNINSINILITTKFLKLQSSLNELILLYQKTANDLLQSGKNLKLNNSIFKCALDIENSFCINNTKEAANMAYWLLDNETTENKIEDKINVKKQLISYSKIIHNIDSIFEVSKPNTKCYFFYFEQTELYTSYPLLNDCQSKFFYHLKNWTYELFYYTLCMNDKAEYYTIYKAKCEVFYLSLLKSKTSSFDNNYLNNINRTIFIINFYGPPDQNTEYDALREFTMCIEFDDPITKGKGYACVDVNYKDIISSLENFNSKINGYYFMSNVGFNHAFYFPQETSIPKTLIENIYKWDVNQKLTEKAVFYDFIEKIMTSNYINNTYNTIYDEAFFNGNNSNEQFIYINKIRFNYSIYPIFLNNLNGQKEHILSIIYIYNDDLYLKEAENYISSITINIILELLLFIIFGYGLLYIVYITFNTLAKHIVIPIKNINYMLKGINIGGKNRLKYLDFLKKKHLDNLDKLEQIYLYENKKNNNDLENNEEIKSYLKDNNDNNYQENEDLINNDNIKSKYPLNKKFYLYHNFIKKYDEESDFIEKEINFHDFDEQLLQYRPYEIENLVKSLIDIKYIMHLTSKDREIEHIINYAYSEKIFINFKKKEGEIICESNIGNLQSQLLNYDKAIYHLAFSLQNNNLKKLFSHNLSDELDEGDSLLKKISYYYNNKNKKQKNNKLVEKQIKNSKNYFSQKLIGTLINTRYCRLIYVYYMFFKKLQKLKKSDKDNMNGQFMNTSFHTINYYHKIIIQFIYLCYIKNDLIKIGESILDYLEFLIKFKFKTLSDDKLFLKINNRNRQEFRAKQDNKKKIFNKIINWFNLFDDYISYVKDNSSLADIKCIIDDYYLNYNSKNFEFNTESQTVFMFRINIQKSNFLKGKFSLYCKNYVDALFYFISAAKKNSIVMDGLIMKRSLKHIYKLLIKMENKFEILRLKNLNMKKLLKEYKKEKNKIFNTKLKIGRKSKNIMENKENNIISFEQEIEIIKSDIIKDIDECNAKQKKDVIILIDLNIYNKNNYNSNIKGNKIDAFIEETIIILNNYLSSYDRMGVLIYIIDYRIICPLIKVNKIDKENFSNDLNYYKNLYVKENYENQEINSNELNEINFNLDENIISENSEEDLFSEKENNCFDKIKGLINTINYIINYLKMKEEVKNERYIILFTKLFNRELKLDEEIGKYFENLKEDKEIIFLLVGKNKKFNLKKEIENNNIFITNNNIEELIINKFNEKSEIINFENMKKIKTILSNNKVIKDKIFFPNEIYK